MEHEGENDHHFDNLEWKLDTCSSKEMYLLSKNSTHVYRCCLKPGLYTLECSNPEGPYGWGSSSISIHGQKYCDDFVGYKALRRIEIFGKNNRFTWVLKISYIKLFFGCLYL